VELTGVEMNQRQAFMVVALGETVFQPNAIYMSIPDRNIG